MKWHGFKYPPHEWKLDIAIILFLLLILLISCAYSPYPHQTKIGYETNTTDKESSDSDTKKTGWSVEQIFRWEEN